MTAPATLADEAARERLARFIAEASGARSVRIRAAEPLRGGAIQENWRVDIECEGGTHPGPISAVLRMDAPSRVEVSLTRDEEFAMLRLAHAAGITVPEPLWLCRDGSVLGRRVVRDSRLGGPRDALAERLGKELARIHAVTPATIARFHAASPDAARVLGRPSASPALDRIRAYRRYLDGLDDPYPTLEWGLRWLELRAPQTAEIVLTHQDFRSGNYMVDGQGLTAILDWEFCAWGDPMSDIGWFCARCWRYGARDREAGGIAPRAPFYRGYEQASGRSIDPTAVHYWEVMAHVRWAVIALQQMRRHLAQGQSSLELALTGRILPELELGILDLLDSAA
jgi:aminoglycoside phosphotransferase (APT) family kinase protein